MNTEILIKEFKGINALDETLQLKNLYLMETNTVDRLCLDL